MKLLGASSAVQLDVTSLALFSIVRSHLIGIISALFPVSCLGFLACLALTATITQRGLLGMCWKSSGRGSADGSDRGVGERVLILLLPGTNTTNKPVKKKDVDTR